MNVVPDQVVPETPTPQQECRELEVPGAPRPTRRHATYTPRPGGKGGSISEEFEKSMMLLNNETVVIPVVARYPDVVDSNNWRARGAKTQNTTSLP